ncbi:MAG: dockerin type I domain-containing protein, partial [Bacillota bacterium]|nr:dockerin type I domain-containing protein [Bacillota bacterium]
YIDNEQSWSTNVVKINLNAALAWVTYYIDAYGFGPEDINRDGAVNMIDVITLAKAFGSNQSGLNFDLRCDLNGDKCINMIDVIKIACKFNSTYASS